MLAVITGNGKGKTTSALGTAIRAAGWQKKVAIVFFDKGGSHYGEQNVLDFLQEKITVFRFGLPRFDEAKKTFRFKNTKEDINEAAKGLQKLRELMDENHFLIVADELISSLNLGLASEKDLKDVLNALPPQTHLILTGRNTPEWLLQKADLVSEVKEVKHPFRQGKLAEKGLEF